jgi:enoyl-[acyl-carrier protein] reductase III
VSSPPGWVVILGVSSGFGAAAARAFADEGYGIFGLHLDRRSTMPAVEALVADLEATGVPVRFVNGNAASDDQREQALDQLAELANAGDVSVVLHSLAFGTLRPFLGESHLKRRQLDMTLDVMANSLVYWVRDLFDRKLLGRGGRVFAMTSSGSLAVWRSYGAVSAAKCALESHIRQLAVELAPHGITANAIMAGVTETPALTKIPGSEEIAERARERNPSGRLTTPEDVARCLISLAGPGTAWMTGNVLRIDGGESIAG